MSSNAEAVNGTTSAAAVKMADNNNPRRRNTRALSGQSARSGRLSVIRRKTTSMLRPEKPVGAPPTALASLKSIITSSWLNLLLVCIPISWILNFVKKDDHTLVFVFSFLAIIPLAKLLGFATKELSLRVGQTLAGLLNATLGNAVELIVSIIALVKCELTIVQSSLIGSILSNLLLVLGTCFFAGGLRFSEQGFGHSSTQLNSSLLTISVIAVLLPAAFHFSLQPVGNGPDPITDQAEGRDILSVSRGASIILLFIYVCYLVFQLVSHQDLFDDDSDDVVKTIHYKPKKNGKDKPSSEDSSNSPPPESAGSAANTVNSTFPLNDNATPNGTATDLENGRKEEHKQEAEAEIPKLSLLFTIGLLVAVTVLVAVTAEFLVDSIDGLTQRGGISKEFVGVILLPIVGNAAEHVTAVTVSVKDKLTLSLGVAVGSSIQIALFVIPFIVTLGWILGKPLTLLFDPYQSVVVFFAVLIVNYTVQDGKSNWLEGIILICLYLILAVTFWFYPGVDPSGVLATCK